MPLSRTGARLICLSLLTLFCLAVHGYHPYAEDGGVYVAGVLKLLHPTLFPHATAFVTEHLRFSLFAPLLAALVHGLHLPLPWLLLLLYLFSVWCTLAAAWMLAARLVSTFAGQLGAVSLLACWLTIPIAGTSLLLADPYLTARSLTTPLTLAALAWSLDLGQGPRARLRVILATALALLAAALLHPLMAAYGAAAVITLLVVNAQRRSLRDAGPWLLFALALATAALVHRLAPPESADYVRVAMTRYYWFPLGWQWYEQIGLIAPFVIFASLARWHGAARFAPAWAALTRAGVVFGAAATLVALAFARAGMATHLVARLQPLRCFGTVYIVMTLLLGAWLGDAALGRSSWRWALLLAALGSLMFFVERQTYPASAHVEWPFGPEADAPRNGWQRAFLWAQTHTPADALFALDAHYITREGEDAQCFRAIAHRSALADYSKDGGEAAITPALTEAWVAGQQAQANLDTEDDATRLRKLKPLGVTWIVLQAATPTAFLCPYSNEAAKVCRLP